MGQAARTGMSVFVRGGGDGFAPVHAVVAGIRPSPPVLPFRSATASTSTATAGPPPPASASSTSPHGAPPPLGALDVGGRRKPMVPLPDTGGCVKPLSWLSGTGSGGSV
uniref:Uncharacterized protein n=1 Tax=Oryza rufipogon TaxID=4529 RepID=A0A0E0RI78_ORYRU